MEISTKMCSLEAERTFRGHKVLVKQRNNKEKVKGLKVYDRRNS